MLEAGRSRCDKSATDALFRLRLPFLECEVVWKFGEMSYEGFLECPSMVDALLLGIGEDCATLFCSLNGDGNDGGCGALLGERNWSCKGDVGTSGT